MISAERVNELFYSCLFKEGEDTTNHIVAEGIMTNVGFHPERLEEAKKEVEEILSQLPENFKESIGGGWSFLEICNDKDGNQWTGIHQRMEQLVLLGIGLKKVKPLLAREFWSKLPGGMPYYVVID